MGSVLAAFKLMLLRDDMTWSEGPVPSRSRTKAKELTEFVEACRRMSAWQEEVKQVGGWVGARARACLCRHMSAWHEDVKHVCGFGCGWVRARVLVAACVSASGSAVVPCACAREAPNYARARTRR